MSTTLPIRSILEYAARERAGLIVLGTHGYGFVRRLVLGSVASAVVREAACSVLLIPPPARADQGTSAPVAATTTMREEAV